MAYVIMLFLFFVVWAVLLHRVAMCLLKNCNSSNFTKNHFLNFKRFNSLFNHWILDFSRTTKAKKLNIFFILLCALSLLFAAHQLTDFFHIYFFFFSALWITIHTDTEQMLISRFVSLYLAPVGVACAWAELLPISLLQSVVGAIFGYMILWFANKLFFLVKKHDGLGQGDMDLMACIGAFTGVLGCWCAITIGSTIGSIFACLYMIITRRHIRMLPFGVFLALGAMIFVLWQDLIIHWLL